MMRRWTAFGAVLCIASCNDPNSAPPKPRPALALRVAPVASQELGPFAGTIDARYKTDQGFRISGRMLNRLVNVGSVVRQGDTLAQLDPTQQKLQVTATEADIANAVAQLANATGDAERKSELAARNEIPRSIADAATAHRNASAAQLEASRATLQKLEQAFEYTTLKAEFSGVVTSWTTEVGQQVAAGQAVVTIARPDVLEASLDVPTDVTQGLARDATFSVKLQSEPTVTSNARIREIGAISDAATRTQRLKLSLDHPPDAFRLGSTVTVAVRRQVTPRVKLPASAVLEEAGHPARVWLVNPGNKVELRPVTIVDRLPDAVMIEGDLPEGALVVAVGVHSLKPDQEVRVAQLP